jgi:hypothetical protein
VIKVKNRWVILVFGLLALVGCSSDYTEEVEALNVQMEILSKNSPLVKVSLVRREKEVTNDGEGLQIFGTTERCNVNTYSKIFLYDVSNQGVISLEDLEESIDTLIQDIAYREPFYINDTLLFRSYKGGAVYLEGGTLKRYNGLSDKVVLPAGTACHSEDFKFKEDFNYIKPKVCSLTWFVENFKSGERKSFLKNSNISIPKSRCESFLKFRDSENLGMLYFENAYYGYLLEGDSSISCVFDHERLIDSTIFESELLSSLTEMRYIGGELYALDSFGKCKRLGQKSVSEFEVLSTECDIYDSRLAWESEAVVFDSVTRIKQKVPKELEFWESRIKTNLKNVGREACD